MDKYEANGAGPKLLYLLFSATYIISPHPSNVDITNRVGKAIVILSKLCL